VSFVASTAVLLAVVTLVALQMRGTDLPAAPVVVVGRPIHVDETFHVPVTLRNSGDDTAANVGVEARMTLSDETRSAEQTVDFLAGGEEVELTFVFNTDPSRGDLAARVTGFAEP